MVAVECHCNVANSIDATSIYHLRGVDGDRDVTGSDRAEVSEPELVNGK